MQSRMVSTRLYQDTPIHQNTPPSYIHKNTPGYLHSNTTEWIHQNTPGCVSHYNKVCKGLHCQPNYYILVVHFVNKDQLCFGWAAQLVQSFQAATSSHLCFKLAQWQYHNVTQWHSEWHSGTVAVPHPLTSSSAPAIPRPPKIMHRNWRGWGQWKRCKPIRVYFQNFQ